LWPALPGLRSAAVPGVRREPAGGVQLQGRTSSDLRLNPHLHLLVLDGAYREQGGELAWQALGHLQTSEVGEVVGRALRRIEKHLRRRGLVRLAADGADLGAEGDADPESQLAASAVSGQAPPAGPQWVRGLQPLEFHALAYHKPLCASLDGFSLHAATRAGALDQAGREALLRYVLRPPIAQERLARRPDALVRITLKKAYADGTVAVDMDPLSLLCRLASSVPPPRFHTVRYAGVLASASPWRSRIAPKPPAETGEPETPKRAGGYRPWAELLARTFPGAHEAARDGHRPGEHRPLPRRGGRGDRGAAPLAEPRPAVLEQPRPAPAGAR
jgi:Putative transposase